MKINCVEHDEQLEVTRQRIKVIAESLFSKT